MVIIGIAALWTIIMALLLLLLWRLWRIYSWLNLHPEKSCTTDGIVTYVTKMGVDCTAGYRFQDTEGHARNSSFSYSTTGWPNLTFNVGDKVRVVYNMSLNKLNYLEEHASTFKNQVWVMPVIILIIGFGAWLGFELLSLFEDWVYAPAH
jgi:hypothetical protein